MSIFLAVLIGPGHKPTYDLTLAAITGVLKDYDDRNLSGSTRGGFDI